jgi:hypothetical protein
MQPQDVLGQAQQIADEFMGLPDSERRSRLMQLRQQDQTLHHLVKEMLAEKRQDMARQGRQQVQQQQYGQQPSSGKTAAARRVPGLLGPARYYRRAG